MRLTRRGTATAASSAAVSSITVTLPAMQQWDLVWLAVAFGSSTGAAGSVTDSNGTAWTFIAESVGTGQKIALYLGVVINTVASVTFTKAAGDATTTMSAIAAAYSGWPATGAGARGGVAVVTDTTTTTSRVGPTATSTPTAPYGAMVLNFGCSHNSALTSTCTVTGTNWNEVVEICSTGATRFRALCLAENQVNTGSVTGATFTWTQSADAHSGVSVWMNPMNESAAMFGSL